MDTTAWTNLTYLMYGAAVAFMIDLFPMLCRIVVKLIHIFFPKP